MGIKHVIQTLKASIAWIIIIFLTIFATIALQ